MRITVLGACGGFPEPGGACSGFLVEHDGFRLVLDLGYATMPRLTRLVDAADVDAVAISHGHPDHCADLNPLLRARALRDDPAPPLPLFAPPGALDAVLALDRPGMLAGAYRLTEVAPGTGFTAGPFTATTRALPHFVPDLGLRLTAGARTLAYTGDCGPDPAVIELSREADLLIAEATYPDEVTGADARYLSSARDAGRQAAEAGAGRLLLTHLWPGSDQARSLAAARSGYSGPLDVAAPGLVIDLD